MNRLRYSVVFAVILASVAGCASGGGEQGNAGACKFVALSSDQHDLLPRLRLDPNAIPPRFILATPPHERIKPLPLTYAPTGAWADNAHIAVGPGAIVFEVDGEATDIGIETLYRDANGDLWREYGPGRRALRRHAHADAFISLAPGVHLLKVRHGADRLKLKDAETHPEVRIADAEFEIKVLAGRNYYLTYGYYRPRAGDPAFAASGLYLAEIVEGVGATGEAERMFMVVGSDDGVAGMTLDHRRRFTALRARAPGLSPGESRALEILYRQSDWARAETLRAGCD